MIPSEWIPDSWAKAFSPTIALLGCIYTPVDLATNLEMSYISLILTLVENSGSNLSMLTIHSSKDVFPALSPIPLIVVWISLAPALIADKVFATASPKSLWQ